MHTPFSGVVIETFLKLGLTTVTGILNARQAHPKVVAPELDDVTFEAKFANFEAAAHQTSSDVAARIQPMSVGDTNEPLE